MTNLDPNADGNVSVYFGLVIDNYDLGVFTGCTGLGMQMGVQPYQEGGGGMFIYQLIGPITYPNLQVTRPVGPWTTNTMAWLNMMAQAINQGVKPTTARLSALDPNGELVYAWNLQGVIPASWQGPTFDAANLQVVTETLELAYTAIMIDPSDASGNLFADAQP